jgi:hypothetical protein
MRQPKIAPRFQRYIGIDYSGAETPKSSLKGLSIYEASTQSPPQIVKPPPSPRKHWSRREIFNWLAIELAKPAPALVGIDHGFSFPIAYFNKHGIKPDWTSFLEDFRQHWPTDNDDTSVDFVRNGLRGNGRARTGLSRWRRIAEIRCGAKSVFHFDVPGSVAKSTHAGLPWLLHLRKALPQQLHFWPFDGWDIPSGKSVVAEAYPSLWSKGFHTENRDPHQHDAYSTARWLSEMDASDSLTPYFSPQLTPQERKIASLEGWILGVA